MSLFRFIVQGVGWEIGRSAAREGIDALKESSDTGDERDDEDRATVNAREEQRRARAARAAVKKREAELERQLLELKKKAGR